MIDSYNNSLRGDSVTSGVQHVSTLEVYVQRLITIGNKIEKIANKAISVTDKLHGGVEGTLGDAKAAPVPYSIGGAITELEYMTERLDNAFKKID